MTGQQRQMINQLNDELRKQGKDAEITWTESDTPESRDFLFGDVDGVTVTVSPGGLINLPAVRTYHPPEYPTPPIAAACAAELWARQKARDDADFAEAQGRSTGHLGPVVGFDLKCEVKVCQCNSEDLRHRQRRAQGGFNTNLYRTL